MSQHDDDYDAGRRAAQRELQPLVDAITDAIFLFNEVGKLSAPTKDQRFLAEQYRSMAKQLQRILALSGLPPPTQPKGDQN